MAQDLSHVIPTRLDSVGKFLFWDLDVAMVAMLGIMLGLGTGYTIPGVVLGVVLASLYGKVKGGRHPGLAIHLAYWWTGVPQPKELPGSHLRDMTG